MTEPAPLASSLVLYQTEDGRTRVQCRFDGGTLWLTQAQMAELFQVGVATVNHHLRGIYEDGEQASEATIRQYRIVQTEGRRQVTREIEHYSLPVILAVGYRVRSPRGTQFRQWATARLEEFLVKGFVLDDERLENPPGPGVPDYFDELQDVTVAKNYLSEPEITELNRIVVMFLDFAEDQARRRKQVFLGDWQQRLDEFLRFNEREVLPDAGCVTRGAADQKALDEFAEFETRRRALREAEGEVDALRALEEVAKRLPERKAARRRKGGKR